MTDLLVPLYRLPDLEIPDGCWVGRPLQHQSTHILNFILEEFGDGWRAEATAAFANTPPRIFVAVQRDSSEIMGFCCWDCTALGFLGPVGVADKSRGTGVGRALVLSVLHSMREAGYGYAVIGGVGPVEFFQSVCDARVIEGSDPGIYGNPI